MTNEEKIEEIVIDAYEGWTKVGFTDEEMIAILSKLAEWKDQQFKEYLEKKLNSYLAYSGSDVVNIQNMGARAAIRGIINELFGEDNKK